MRTRSLAWLALLVPWMIASSAHAALRSSVSQWGITWHFDRAYETGQFVNGDWWVIGPVTIVSVSPGPSRAQPGEEYSTAENQFGDAALQRDDRMRNGSMVVLRQRDEQGYDSRVINYDPSLSIQFPYQLGVNRSLISTISLRSTLDNPNFFVGHFEDAWAVLQTAAVLTCLAEVPPPDAFRPPYAGTEKPIFRASDLRRELLPRLASVPSTPSLALFERYFERVWIDHSHTWVDSRISPLENMPGYGREYARLTGMAGLMLMLDREPQEKETLLVRFVQLGIDLHGVRLVGGTWPGDGGIWSGRKWPIVFAALLLGRPEMLPDPTDTETRFGEDQQTYFGTGYDGATALYQMVVHHGPVPPYEEKPPSAWTTIDKRSDNYRRCCTSIAWVATALAALHLRAVRAWGHDAFFAYADRWMREEGRVWDEFVNQMWAAHRASAPRQAGARANWKWVWDGGGTWVPNVSPVPEPGSAALGGAAALALGTLGRRRRQITGVAQRREGPDRG